MALSPASRRAYGIAGAVLAGCISSTVFSTAWDSVGTSLSVIIYATILPLFVAGLSGGALSGVIASAAGFINLMVREPSNYAVMYAILYALPAAALIALTLRHRAAENQKLRWYPEGRVMLAVALYPCALFLIMAGLSWSHHGGLLGLTQDAFAKLSASATKTGLPQNVMISLNTLARYLPAVSGSAWIIVTMTNLLAGQSALQQHKWNIRPSLKLRDIQLPAFMIAVVVLGIAAGPLTNDPYSYFGVNLGIMLAMPLLFVGVAVVHAWAATKKWPKTLLAVFYAVLLLAPFIGTRLLSPGIVLVSPFVAVIVVLLGAAEPWAHFRQRFPEPTRTA